MERVLVNLLENAAKYGAIASPDHATQTAATILVRAVAIPGTLEMTVRDFGPGLPAHSKGKETDLFEKFTRGASESNKRGVGLGLAICKAIVQAHRGQISAAQAAGGGAEFKVRLPRNPPPDMPPDLPADKPNECYP